MGQLFYQTNIVFHFLPTLWWY